MHTKSSVTIPHEKSHPVVSRNPVSRIKKNPVPASIPHSDWIFVTQDPVPHPVKSRSRPVSRNIVQIFYFRCNFNRFIVISWLNMVYKCTWLETLWQKLWNDALLLIIFNKFDWIGAETTTKRKKRIKITKKTQIKTNARMKMIIMMMMNAIVTLMYHKEATIKL